MKNRRSPRSCGEWTFCSAIVLVSWLAAGILLVNVGYLILRGLGPLTRNFRSGIGAESDSALLSLWIHTLSLLFGGALLAVPLAIGTGIYLSEYARESRVKQWVLTAVGGLAEMPPIIYGLFGWGALAPYFGGERQTLIFVLTSAVWLLPQLVSVTYSALQEVPVSFRRDSLALGGTYWQTTWSVLMSFAGRSLAAEALEGMARVGGETAPVIMIAAAWQGLQGKPLVTLPYHLYRSVVESLELIGSHHFGTALLLVLTSICFQAAALRLRKTGVSVTGSVRERERGRWW